MTRWRDTWWYRIPRAIGRRSIHRALALFTALAVGVPSLALAAWGRRWAPTFARWALSVFTESRLGRQFLANLDPARRAGLPARIEAMIIQLIPKLVLMGFAGAIVGAAAVWTLGRYLDRALDAPDPAGSPASRRGWLSTGVAFLVGLAAHVFALRQSLNTDEAAAVFHALTRSWSWADTRPGWQTHMGGELLAALGMALFGQHDWAARLLIALSSAAGLALTYRWIERLRGVPTAILATGLLCALPLWSEETALARGYGLLFLGGALVLPALWDVLDGTAVGRESNVLARLFLGSLLGFLAHFFFFFLALGALTLLAWAGRRSNALAAAGAAWMALGLVAPGLLYVPGLPATLYQTHAVGRLPFSTVPLRFVNAFGFDLPGAGRWIACGILLSLLLLGFRFLSKPERRRILVLLLIGMALPWLMRPVYLYPRFFTHLLPLLFVAVLPIARLRMPAVAAILVAVVLWAIPRPWHRLPAIDLRGGAEIAKKFERPGETIYVDRFFNTAQFYLRGVPSQALLLQRGIPSGARVLLTGREPTDPEPAFPRFHLAGQRPGREMELLVFVADR